MLQGTAFEQLLDLAQVALYAAVELPVGQLQTNAAEELGVRLRREVRAARRKTIGYLRDGNNLYAVAQIHGIADDRADINKILYLFD